MPKNSQTYKQKISIGEAIFKEPLQVIEKLKNVGVSKKDLLEAVAQTFKEDDALLLKLNDLLEKREGRVFQKWLDTHPEAIQWIVQVLDEDLTVSHIIADEEGKSTTILTNKEHTGFYGIPSNGLLGQVSFFAFNTIFEAVQEDARDLFVKTQYGLRDLFIKNQNVVWACNKRIPIYPKGETYKGTWYEISVPQTKKTFESGLSLRAAFLLKTESTKEKCQDIGTRGCQNIAVMLADGRLVVERANVDHLDTFLETLTPTQGNVWFLDLRWFNQLTTTQKVELIDALEQNPNIDFLTSIPSATNKRDRVIACSPDTASFFGRAAHQYLTDDWFLDAVKYDLNIIPEKYHIEFLDRQQLRRNQALEGVSGSKLPPCKCLIDTTKIKSEGEPYRGYFLVTPYRSQIVSSTGEPICYSIELQYKQLSRHSYEELCKLSFDELQQLENLQEKSETAMIPKAYLGLLPYMPDQISSEFNNPLSFERSAKEQRSVQVLIQGVQEMIGGLSLSEQEEFFRSFIASVIPPEYLNMYVNFQQHKRTTKAEKSNSIKIGSFEYRKRLRNKAREETWSIRFTVGGKQPEITFKGETPTFNPEEDLRRLGRIDLWNKKKESLVAVAHS